MAAIPQRRRLLAAASLSGGKNRWTCSAFAPSRSRSIRALPVVAAGAACFFPIMFRSDSDTAGPAARTLLTRGGRARDPGQARLPLNNLKADSERVRADLAARFESESGRHESVSVTVPGTTISDSDHAR